jgi:hypothetical protein
VVVAAPVSQLPSRPGRSFGREIPTSWQFLSIEIPARLWESQRHLDTWTAMMTMTTRTRLRTFRTRSRVGRHHHNWQGLDVPFNVEFVAQGAIGTTRDAVDFNLVLAVLFDGVFRNGRKDRLEFQAMGLHN